MFCSKCGKEIADEAIICPVCGCATANYHPFTDHNAQSQNNNSYSQDYIALKEFEDKVNSLYTISIIALILFLGIGIIFTIVFWLKLKTIFIPQITTTNPNEIAMYESIKRKLGKASSFANAPLYVLIIFLVPAFLYGQMFGAAALVFVGCIAIIFLIMIPCAKHLNMLNEAKK